MTSKVEEVARAIDPMAWAVPEYDYPAERARREAKQFASLSQARAAIKAIRDIEPTDAMMSAMWSLSYSNSSESFRTCWQAIIDAALGEEGR